jgi:hypothetical protein
LWEQRTTVSVDLLRCVAIAKGTLYSHKWLSEERINRWRWAATRQRVHDDAPMHSDTRRIIL